MFVNLIAGTGKVWMGWQHGRSHHLTTNLTLQSHTCEKRDWLPTILDLYCMKLFNHLQFSFLHILSNNPSSHNDQVLIYHFVTLVFQQSSTVHSNLFLWHNTGEGRQQSELHNRLPEVRQHNRRGNPLKAAHHWTVSGCSGTHPHPGGLSHCLPPEEQPEQPCPQKHAGANGCAWT